MDPEKMMGAMNEAMRDWQEKQGEFFTQAMRQWGFGAPDTVQESAPPPPPAERPAPPQEAAEKEEKIKAIEENLEALQDQLKKLR